MKPWVQTARQKEIEELARAYVAANPYAYECEVAAALGMHPSRLNKLRRRKRINVDIPAHAAIVKRHNQGATEAMAVDTTRPAV